MIISPEAVTADYIQELAIVYLQFCYKIMSV
jgi:hypothetical protein